MIIEMVEVLGVRMMQDREHDLNPKTDPQFPRAIDLSGQQLALFRALKRWHSDLAQMYLGALLVMRDGNNPDALALAAHGIRELMEKLPTFVDVPLKAHNESLLPRVQNIESRWTKVLRKSSCYADGEWRGEIDNPLRQLLRHLQDFFTWLNDHRPRRREEIRRTLRQLDAPGHVLLPPLEDLNVSAWMKMREFFNKVAHHGPPPSKQKFLQQLDALERFLLDRFNPRTFDDFTIINAILEAAAEIKPEVVRQALEIIKKRAANYEYFFDRLDSPAWIEPLYQEGFFRNPPSAERDGDYIRFPIWPESRYLVRMARLPEAQAQVLQIALQIPETDNVRVLEDLADIALSLPPSMATRFVPKAKEWLEVPHHLLLPEKLGALVAHLAKGGEGDAALDLARTVLAVVPDRETAPNQEEGGIFTPSPQPRSRFDPWEYEDILKKHVPILVETTGERAMDLLCDILESAISLSRHDEKGGELKDYSYVWRPAIEDHAQNYPHRFKDFLVTAVRDAAEYLVQQDPTKVSHLVTRLEARRWSIFQRIALHLLRCFPDAAESLIAERLTDHARFNNPDLRHEYVLLARDCFSRLSQKDQETILGWIAEGPNLKDWKDYWERCTEDYEAERYKKIWQRDRLAPLADALPAAWKRYYNELIQEFGPAEHPEFLVYSEGGWVGPTSPKSTDELRAMSIEELVAYLRTWEPQEGWRSPSPEGLGRELSALVASEPERFAAAALRFKGLDPTYVRSLLRGLCDAARNGHVFSWEQAIDLAQWIVEQNQEIPERKSECAERDPGWGWTRRTIAELLSAGFDHGPAEIPFDLRERVWVVLRPLTDDPDPTPEHEARFGGPNMDPAALSINTTRGEAIHAVVRYALWVRRHLEAEVGQTRVERGFDEMPEVREVLEFHLDPNREPSVAVRAVYGQWFPWLVLLDAQWAAAQKSHIFSAAPERVHLRDAAWETYIIFCQPYDKVFDILKDEYGWAIERIGSQTVDHRHLRDPNQRLAEHIMELYWRGKLALDEPGGLLDQFYAKADDALRGHAIDFVGRSLMNSEGEVSAQIIDRLKALWEHRVAAARTALSPAEFTEELSAFGWWFASGKFELNWALSQLKVVLDLVQKVEPDHIVVERLAGIAESHPLDAVYCLNAMLLGEKEGWRIMALKDEARTILEKALESIDPEARTTAEELINRLGARGYWEFGDLLK